MGFWGLSAIGLFVGYWPPKRHTRFDHLSFWQKIGRLDLPGTGLLTVGLTLFLTSLNLPGGTFTWSSAQVLGTLVAGIVVLIAFSIYEWKFTQTGILHHDLFRGGKDRGRTFAICLGLIFIEGVLLFAFVIFYPTLYVIPPIHLLFLCVQLTSSSNRTLTLFETDPFLLAGRGQAFWVTCGLSTVVYGYAATSLGSIKSPLFVGFLLSTSGIVGLATIQPSDSTSAIIFAGIFGLGMGGPLVLVITGVQLSTPHHLIATATAVTASFRAVSATTFTAINSAALTTRLNQYIPSYVGTAAIKAGLPKISLEEFIGALTSNNSTALAGIQGATPTIIQASVVALKQAYADGLRAVYMIAAPFGAVACIACFLLGDLKPVMNYSVDAPVEDLHAKRHRNGDA